MIVFSFITTAINKVYFNNLIYFQCPKCSYKFVRYFPKINICFLGKLSKSSFCYSIFYLKVKCQWNCCCIVKLVRVIALTTSWLEINWHGKVIERVQFSSFSSVAQSCPTLYDPMNRSTPGLPVHHHFPEFTQTHVHWVGDAIQPSHLLSSPSPPTPNPSQHQRFFQWVNSLHDVAKVLEFQL